MNTKDIRGIAGNLKSAGELGKYSLDWWVQYATNKNLKSTLKTSQTAEEMAALEGISLGRYRRTTRARITDGISEMESIGGKAKSTSKFGKGDLLFIGNYCIGIISFSNINGFFGRQ